MTSDPLDRPDLEDLDLDALDLLHLSDGDPDAPSIEDLAIALRESVLEAIRQVDDDGLTIEDAIAPPADGRDRMAATRHAAARLLALQTLIEEGDVELLLVQREPGGPFGAVVVASPEELEQLELEGSTATP